MVRGLAEWGIRRQALALVLGAAVLVAGVIQLDETEIDTLPEFLPPIVEVQTEALGLSADEVEQLITVPLEADLLNGVAWLEKIESTSMPGLSSIVMTFEPGTEILGARQVVQERLTQAAGLPNVSRAPAMVQPLSAESRVMMIGLSSDEVSLIDMSVLARWTVRPFLMGVSGVANVSVWGQRERQLQVLVDQDVLADAEVPLLDVVKTTGNALWVSPLTYLEASTPGVGGFIDGPNQRIGVQHVLGIETPEDLASIAVQGHENLTLGAITEVVEDHQPLIGDAVVQDGPGLLLVVEKFPWSNTIETTQRVEDALGELAPGLRGITVDTGLFRPADYLKRSIDSAQLATVVAVLAVVAVALVLMAGWRAAAVATISLLVSLVASGLVLLATDTQVNVMVFAGLVLAFGLLVDDAIGNAGTIGRSLEEHGDTPAARSIVDTVVELLRPLMYATVVIALAMSPVLIMEGAAGEFLPSVAFTAVVAMVVSIVVSATLTPALSAALFSGADRRTESAVMAWARSRLATLRGPAVPRWSAGVVAVLLLVAGLGVIPTLDRQYVPDFEQTDLVIRFDGVAGTSLDASRRIARSVAAEVRSVDGVLDVGAHMGRAVLSDEIVNVNSAELWVKIDPDADYDDAITDIQEIVAGYPGYGIPGAITYSNDRINEVLRRSNRDLVVRVYGEDPIVLGETADAIAELVEGIDGTENVRALHPILEPAIEIEVDLDRAAEHEIKPGDVRRTAATLLSGIEVGSFFEQQKVFEVVVWSPPERRDSITSVEQLLVNTPDGDVVALAEVADVRVSPVANAIRREAVSRYIDVTADISSRSHGAIEDDIKAAVADRGLPFEYHVRVLDDTVDAASNQRQFVAMTVAIAIAIILLLQAAFASWRLAAVVFVTTPLALAGGFLALAISGGTYSIGASIGLFGVYAITLRQSMSLLDRWDTLQLARGKPFGPEVVAEGLDERFPAMATALLAVGLAMLGVVLVGAREGLEVIRPFAMVMLGGVLTSAIVTLFVLPAAYVRFGRPAVARESLIGEGTPA